MNKKTVFILSITSDIGTAIAERYAAAGHRVVGTYRTNAHLEQLSKIPELQLFQCDLESKDSIADFLRAYRQAGINWDDFISCPCTPLPLGPFFQCDFDEWSASIHTNVLEQLRILHGLHAHRTSGKINNVVFFAGGGTNNAVLNFSAYTSSKIMLIKMCELIDAENPDLNVFIVGPGWTKTKTHYITLEHVDKNDKKYSETVEFMNSGTGTSMQDIHDCISWLMEKGKAISGGRNFSVVHDKWKGGRSESLAELLAADPNMYKLRRHGNNIL